MGFVNFKNYRVYILTSVAYLGSLLFGELVSDDPATQSY
jgi:hypothetical protein